MKLEVVQRKEIDVKYLRVEAEVRYFEDATVNGEPDSEESPRMPFVVGSVWRPVIDIDAGKVVDWPEGVTADVHYKVCDAGVYVLLDESRAEVHRADGYVPDILSPGGSGYGDYIIMSIDGSGQIAKWRADLSDFEPDDDD